MKRFAGFPASMQFTSIPNLFFSAVLPQINDIAELKTTLHIFGAIYRKRGYPRFTTYGELTSNKSLMQSLKEANGSPEETLKNALEMAVSRGTILRLALERDGASEDIYFINTEQDKQAIARIQSGELSLSGLKAKRQPYTEIEEQPDIFTTYEQNIGMLTPIVADELREAEKMYPADWIRDAIKESVELNKRNWRYISAILERWSAEGRGDGTHRRDSKKTDPDKYLKQKYGNIIKR